MTYSLRRHNYICLCIIKMYFNNLSTSLTEVKAKWGPKMNVMLTIFWSKDTVKRENMLANEKVPKGWANE